MQSRVRRPFIGRSRPAASGFFEGGVRSYDLVAGETEMEVISVWFEPGGRTVSHRHPTEQVLIVTEGEIAVGIERERYLLKRGDVIVIPRDVWHWHGATPFRAGAHLSVKPFAAAGEWGDPPTDEQAEFRAYDDWDGWVDGLT